jgi:hypothetical protein
MEDVMKRRCGMYSMVRNTKGQVRLVVLCQVDVSCAETLTLCWSWGWG